jgi:hypothetical protein
MTCNSFNEARRLWPDASLVLEKASWNQSRASQVVKISCDALKYKMKKFNLEPPPGV